MAHSSSRPRWRRTAQDALYTLNGVAGSSTTDTVTDALPGVTLTLNGVTGTDNPVTVNVQPPTANVAAIESAVNQFVQDYNSAVSSIESAVNTEPTNSSSGGTYNQDAGSLFGDSELEDLLSNMRTTMYTPGSGAAERPRGTDRHRHQHRRVHRNDPAELGQRAADGRHLDS